MRKMWASLLGAGLVLTGCSGTAAPAPTVTVTVTVTPEAAPSPTPTPQAPANALLPLGTPKALANATITVYAVNLDPVPESAPQPQRAEDKWVSVDLETCPQVEATVSTAPWGISDTEHHAFRASSTGYSQFPEPAYAWGDVSVAPGGCHRGWITFVVAKASTLVSVDYSNQRGERASWVIS